VNENGRNVMMMWMLLVSTMVIIIMILRTVMVLMMVTMISKLSESVVLYCLCVREGRVCHECVSEERDAGVADFVVRDVEGLERGVAAEHLHVRGARQNVALRRKISW